MMTVRGSDDDRASMIRTRRLYAVRDNDTVRDESQLITLVSTPTTKSIR